MAFGQAAGRPVPQQFQVEFVESHAWFLTDPAFHSFAKGVFSCSATSLATTSGTFLSISPSRWVPAWAWSARCVPH